MTNPEQATCPCCGQDISEPKSVPDSNAQRQVTLTIPEQHWPIFHIIFREMNVRFGMMGQGELANLMPSYQDQLPLDFQKFRYFSHSKLAYVFIGIQNGYALSLRIEPGGKSDYEGNDRMKVIADLTRDDQETPVSFVISEGCIESIARDVCAYLEDAAQRMSPLR